MQPLLADRYKTIRGLTMNICEPLSPADFEQQGMPDVSPPKWHLAHTTWFFERIVLQEHLKGYDVFNPRFDYLFNSYYESLGERHPRPKRGMLVRPSLEEVLKYREYVDKEMVKFLERPIEAAVAELVEIGLQHEQQHQGKNPLYSLFC